MGFFWKVVVALVLVFAVPTAFQRMPPAFWQSIISTLPFALLFMLLGAGYGFLVGASKYRFTRIDLVPHVLIAAVFGFLAGIAISPGFWKALNHMPSCPQDTPICAIGTAAIAFGLFACVLAFTLAPLWYFITRVPKVFIGIKNIREMGS